MESDLSAERAWQKLLRYINEWVNPDINFSNKPELLDPIRRAANAAGGLNWLRECSSDELQWAKKRFLEFYDRMVLLEKDKVLIEDPTIRGMFEELGRNMAIPEKSNFHPTRK